MRFGIVNPSVQSARIERCENFEAACAAVGLVPGEIEFEALTTAIQIAVYEFGFFVPPHEQYYFTTHRRLYAGNALLFGIDDKGKRIDLEALPAILYLPTAAAVERAIDAGIVGRPQITLTGGSVIWRWPEPPPLTRRKP
jgi:hypothetical protein